MAFSTLPEVAELRELLTYDPITGDLRWLTRPRACFSRDRIWLMWNRRFAGQIAGHRRHGYILLEVNKASFSAHRLIWKLMTGDDPSLEIDHINGDKADNRWENLRIATRSENRANQPRYRSNTSGFKGVHPASRNTGRWEAAIMFNGSRRHLGTFDTPEEAYEAYCRAAIKVHGIFANVGHI